MAVVKTREHPMLFSAPMVRALLREPNPKTQTRRAVTPQPERASDMIKMLNVRGTLSFAFADMYGDCLDRPDIYCPYGVPGDRLWVREAFYIDHMSVSDGDSLPKVMPPEWADMIYYRADGECCEQIPECSCAEVGKPKWRPSIHMPRWASRITLEVVSRRTERVEDISDADAVAEGFESRAAFLHTFYDLNKRAERGSNPWVWVVEFRREETPHA